MIRMYDIVFVFLPECAVCNCFPVHRDTKDVDLTSDESSGKEVLEKFFDSLLKSKKVCTHPSTVIGYVNTQYMYVQ